MSGPARLNLESPEREEPREHPGFTCRRWRLGHRLETQRLGVSLWELPAGEAAYPYHYHLADEELIIVLAGSGRLRTPDGWSDLGPGDLVSFPTGEAGAHQVVNASNEPVRFLAVSTSGTPDVVIYPDERKLSATERQPAGGGLAKFFRLEDDVPYWEGVVPPDPSERTSSASPPPAGRGPYDGGNSSSSTRLP